MLRLLFITDYTETFSYKLLKGITNYSEEKGQWSICRMPSSYKNEIGIPGLLKWAKDWEIDAIIGRFEESDNIDLIRDNGIIVMAQDFKKRFKNIPNITADYIGTGRMAARFYLERGFHNFGFFGFNDVCWSDERREGFRKEIKDAGFGDSFYEYKMQDIDQNWHYEREKLTDWLSSLPKPIAIMACDDNQGNNLIEACNSAGIRIPAEVSVIGVDNDDLMCNLSLPSLSSISVDIEKGGYRAAQMIEHLVSNPDAIHEDIVLMPIRIVGRLSTAAYATDDREIQKAVLFIHQNSHRKISVEDVVKKVALSRRLLEIRFKKVTGQSIWQYISDLKLKTFADMLLETNDQVINIALSLGESDAKNISKKFKAVYGCSPNEWRVRNLSRNDTV